MLTECRKQSVATFKSAYGTFKRSSTYRRPHLTPSYTIRTGTYDISQSLANLRATFGRGSSSVTSTTSTYNEGEDHPPVKQEQEAHPLRAQEKHYDLVAELTDANCMNPTGSDLHDDIMQALFLKAHPSLPPSYPARHMHIINLPQLADTESIPIFEYVLPRLCDAVATTLFEAGPEVLEAFLDPRNKIFELWRRTHATHYQPSIVIRRAGNEVLVGSFRSQGFKYIWGYYVKSVIDFTGKWTETYASPWTAASRVTKKGLDWDSFEVVEKESDIDPEDAKFAVWIGRSLARRLLEWRVWDYDEGAGDRSELVVDGKVMRVRMRRRTDREGSGGEVREQEE